MSASTAYTVPGSYVNSEGALCLPMHHLYTGEKLGEQIRYPDGRRMFTKGVSVRECAPIIWRPDDRRDRSGWVMALEGPTDLIAVVESGVLPNWTLVACWSASILPPRNWWTALTPYNAGTIAACGDGDMAGAAFNQRLADIMGMVYPVRIPTALDAHDVIALRGEQEFHDRVIRAINGQAIYGRPPRHLREPDNNNDLPSVPIMDLLERSGARHAMKLSSGQHKFYCGMHEDRNDPSLTVNPDTGDWKCWAGCGQGGVLQFVMAWKGFDRRRAQEFLRGWR